MIADSMWRSKLYQAIDSAGNTPLHIAAKHGNLAAIKILLEHPLSSNVYLVNNNGKTPMHMAAEDGRIG